MFVLIMKRIQDSSESSIEVLMNRVKNLKISDIAGENVDDAIALVRSTYSLLVDSSTEDRNNVPDSFPLTVLQVFQTTSNATFNENFARIVRDAQLKAYEYEGRPVYSPVENTLRIAKNMYLGMKDTWKGSDGKKSAFVAGGDPTKTVRDFSKCKCFNCGKFGHIVPQCPDPKNLQMQETLRKEHAAAKHKSGKHKPHRETKMTRGGVPMVKNKNGAFVVDAKKQKALKEKKEKAAQEKFQSDFKAEVDKAVAAAVNSPAPPTQALVAETPAPASAPASTGATDPASVWDRINPYARRSS